MLNFLAFPNDTGKKKKHISNSAMEYIVILDHVVSLHTKCVGKNSRTLSVSLIPIWTELKSGWPIIITPGNLQP